MKLNKCVNSEEETQQNMKSTSDVEIISRKCASQEKHETMANWDIKKKGTEVNIVVSGYFVVQFGTDGKISKQQNCKMCSKNCYSSSDEENNAVTCKKEEVATDSHDAHYDSVFEHEPKCSSMIYSEMPIIPKRGCMETSQYVSLITKLKDLRGKGDFDGHEQMVEGQMAILRSAADPDMDASLQIERAMVFYFQNNMKDAKRILKSVVKQEQQLENSGILVGRAFNLLTAIYKRQRKFGNAMKCVERATTYLEGRDSPDDKAELYHSYGALITALPAAKNDEACRGTKEEAYKSYEMAGHYTGNDECKEFTYLHVKMAALLLASHSNAERRVKSLSKEDILKAKKHLNFVEPRIASNRSLGTEIKFLLLRSDQYLSEGNVAMAMEKAQEANELIDQHGFKLESVPAKKRIDYLSAMQKQEIEEWQNREFCSSNDYLADRESAPSSE